MKTLFRDIEIGAVFWVHPYSWLVKIDENTLKQVVYVDEKHLADWAGGTELQFVPTSEFFGAGTVDQPYCVVENPHILRINLSEIMSRIWSL